MRIARYKYAHTNETEVESAGKAGSRVLYNIAMTDCEQGLTSLVRRNVLATAKLRSNAKDCRRSERNGKVDIENYIAEKNHRVRTR